MTAYVALLRAVNVAGHQPVSMVELRRIAESLGFDNVRTLLQSGNLVFETDPGTHGAIEAKLEEAARRELNLDTDFMVRSASDWDKRVANNPFPAIAESDAGRLVLLALKDAVPADRFNALRSKYKGPEEIRHASDSLYVSYSEGIGRSKLTNKLIEDALKTRATGRNWNTVLKLQAMLSG